MPNRLRKDGLGSVRSIQPNSGASSTPKEDEQRREHRDVQSTRAEQSEVRAVALNDGPPKHRQKHEPRERGNGDRACEVSQGGCRGPPTVRRAVLQAMPPLAEPPGGVP